MKFDVDGLSFHYGLQPVLHRICFQLEPGITALVGPNAAGKSTLLKCLCGLLTATAGTITLNDRPLKEYSRQELAKHVSYLPQTPFKPGRLTVFETVLLGRLHELGWRVSQPEIDRVHRLLNEMSLTSLANRMTHELSGGQAQLVAVAQALVSEPSILLLDEPTSNLDLRRQFEVCSQIRELTVSRGLRTIITMHDLNLAARYADRLLVLNQGTLYASGPPSQIITASMVAEVYQVIVEVTPDRSGFPTVAVQGPCAERVGTT